MGTAHHNRGTRSANSIGYAIGLSDHTGHCADANESNIFVDYEFSQRSVTHRLSIAVNQQNFMAGRSKRLQKEHPQMWHEVTRHAVIWAIEKDFHNCSRGVLWKPKYFLSCC